MFSSKRMFNVCIAVLLAMFLCMATLLCVTYDSFQTHDRLYKLIKLIDQYQIDEARFNSKIRKIHRGSDTIVDSSLITLLSDNNDVLEGSLAYLFNVLINDDLVSNKQISEVRKYLEVLDTRKKIYSEIVIDNFHKGISDVDEEFYDHEFIKNTEKMDHSAILVDISYSLKSEIDDTNKKMNRFINLGVSAVVVLVVIALLLVRHLNLQLLLPLTKVSKRIASRRGYVNLSSNTSSIELNVFLDELNSLQDSLIEMKNDAENEARKKIEFTNYINHEIRNPVNVIMGNLEIISGGSPQRELEDIRVAGNLISNIVNDVLEYSKLDYQSYEPEIAEFEINELLESVMKLTSSSKDYITTEYYVNDDMPIRMKGDINKITQVMCNIIINSYKHSKASKLRVRFKCNEDSVRLSITDNGVGIEKKLRNKLFEPFTQAKAKSGTTGLGMTISKQLVTAMGGGIKVRSHVNIGTAFYIHLPFNNDIQTRWSEFAEKQTILINKNISNEELKLISRHFPNPKAALNREGEVQESDMRFRSPFDVILKSEQPGNQEEGLYTDARLLFVDDFDLNIKLLKRFSEKYNLNASFAADGQQALSLIRERAFDIIFMDINMPVLDGIETTKAIRAQGIETTIIGLTANVGHLRQQECLDVGMNGYMTKPIDISKLKIAIAN